LLEFPSRRLDYKNVFFNYKEKMNISPKTLVIIFLFGSNKMVGLSLLSRYYTHREYCG
jgi:hypothetical protein